MQYVEQEWDFDKVKAGAEFGLPGGTRCTVLDWNLREGVTTLLVKYYQHGADHLMRVLPGNGIPKVGPRLVLFVPVKETVARRRVTYDPAFGGDGILCHRISGELDNVAGEVVFTVSHVPGEPPRLTGARVV